MNCEYYRIQISAMMDGELTEAERAEVLAHLPHCSACRAAMEEAGQIEAALRGWTGARELPPGLRLPEWADLESGLTLERRAWRRWLRIAVPVAASFLALVGGFLIFDKGNMPRARGSDVRVVCRPVSGGEQLAAQLAGSVLLDSQGKGLDEIAVVASSRQALEDAMGLQGY